MPTIYTLTAGEHPKLLATLDGTSRTVTSLKGMAADAARDLAESLSQVENDLTRWTADPDAFAAQATRLGLRAAQVTADDRLTVSVIADQPAPRNEVPRGPDTFRVWHLARVLQLCVTLPDPSQRAVRNELHALLARFDGPVVVAEIGCLDGLAAVNAALWCATDTGPGPHHGDQHLGDLLLGAWPDNAQAAEQVAWYYSQPGQALEGAAQELVAAEADSIEVFCSLHRVVARLAETRPELLAALVTEAETLDLDDTQEAAMAYARDLLAPAD